MFKKFSAALVAAFFMSVPVLAQAPQGPLVAQAWLPVGNISGGVSVTSSTSNTALPASGDVAWVCNTGSADAYIAFGGSSIAATTAGSSLIKSQTCSPYSKRLNSGTLATFIAAITASGTTTLSVETGIGTPPSSAGAVTPGSPATLSGSITNPTSVLTRPANTSTYTSGATTPQLVASNATAGSIVVPSFNIANVAGAAAFPRVRIGTNVTTGWGAATFVVTLWSAAPTYTNGDRGNYAVATGSVGRIAAYNCTLTQDGDGASAPGCAITQGNFAAYKAASGQAVFWDLQYTGSATLTPISGQTFTLTAEVMN